MDNDEHEPARDAGRSDPAPADRSRRWPPVWPWLVLVGLAAIAVGVAGPLVNR